MYAWQVEVAAGELVMAANRVMGKGLGAGARCRLRSGLGYASTHRGTEDGREEIADFRATSGDAGSKSDQTTESRDARRTKKGMQDSGAEREARLREPYLKAGYHVQNLRQFVCELEQNG